MKTRWNLLLLGILILRTKRPSLEIAWVGRDRIQIPGRLKTWTLSVKHPIHKSLSLKLTTGSEILVAHVLHFEPSKHYLWLSFSRKRSSTFSFH